MEYNIRDIITFSDGNDYGIVSKTTYQDNTYALLTAINNEENVKFCIEKVNNEELILSEIEDQELMRNLLPRFASEVFKLFNTTEEN